MPLTSQTLSQRHRDLVAAIATFTRERRYCPTLVELAAILRLSVSRTKNLADLAERRGAITHEPRRSRSWRVVRPDDILAG